MPSCDIFKRRKGAAYRILCGFLAFAFLFSWILPPGYAQTGTGLSLLSLPAPGTMVTPTTAFTPALINGITIHPDNPLEFDFIVGTGDENLQGKAFEEESTRLIKYFLASLTVPEDEMWVNLSPYEKDRIIPEGFGTTEMGRDLLAQDYILKQLTASLMYPEEELGSEFWKKIYQKAYEEYGTTEIPVNTFNKVWIVPEKAVVYEHGQSAFVVKSHLRVMLEEDYLAMQQESSVVSLQSSVSSTIIKEIILPAIEKEVNEGKSFANLRQIYNSAILATWFKQNLKETLLGQVYVDKAKTKGVDVDDKTINQKIYAQYLEAFKKGVYNYIKEDVDPATQEVIPRKYFSGGTNLKVGDLVETYKEGQPLTREHQEVLGEYLASLKKYNRGQRRVNVNLVELSEEMSVAQAREAIRQATGSEGASSPVDYEYWAQRLNLGSADLIHMKGLLRKFAAEKIQLVIGRNFFPSALLTEKERQKFLGATEYIRISGDASNAEEAKDVVVTFNPLDGGLGSNIKRETYLERMVGRTQVGAKATDLFLKYKYKIQETEKTELVSIAEIKLLRVIKDSSQFGSTIFQPVVNKDSAPSYKDLLNNFYLEDRINPAIPKDFKRTYRQVMEQTGVRLLPAEDQMLYQKDLPVIDIENGELTDKFTAPGGHGQLGVRLLLDALNFQIPGDGRTHIRAFYNGDGIANMPDAAIIGWMAKNDVPIVMISTTKTGLDRKGGQLGTQRLGDGTTVRPQILEVAQAKKPGKAHENLFYDIGLSGLGKVEGIDENGNPKEYTNEIHQQYFNTNIALLNYNVLAPVLKELKELADEEKVEFEGEMLSGDALIERIISPDLIENVKKKDDGKEYTQLEGALASTLLNLDAFFMTTKDKDPRVKDILERKGIKKILHVVNVDHLQRTNFFTPVKNAFDFWLQSHSDSYTLDRERWTLVEGRDGLELPTVEVVAYKRDDEHRLILDEKGDPQDDGFYANVLNVIDSFGTASTKGLVSLDIKGRVAFKDAVLKGSVRIISEYRNPATKHVFDLNGLEARTALGQEGYQPLVLENMEIRIDQDGSLRWKPITRSPILSDDENIDSSTDEIEDDMRPSSPVAQGLRDYLQERQAAGEITPEEAEFAARGVNDWLTRPGYPLKLVQKLKALIANQDWGTITESFYKEVDFGTAGKRGRQVDAQGDVLPGPNNINDYTVAEYTLGLARYLLKTGQQDRGVVLGGDTRIKSILPYRGEESYVELQAKILRKMGIKVYRFKEPRSIGHVAWTAVANDAASMEYNSASHNMWTDNGVKASNEFGAQLFTDERAGILGEIKEVEPEDIAAMNLDEFDLEVDRGQNPGMHVLLGSQEDRQRDPSIVDADTGYIEANRRYVENMDVIRGYSSQVHSFYTPIQGAGVYTIPNILTDGEDFEFQVVLSQEQRSQDAQGRFGAVEKPDPNYINEDGARTLDKAIREAEDMERSSGVSFDFVFGTDPDADRSSYAVRDREGNWKVLKANDVWSLFAWYRLTQMARQGRLKTGTWAIETWVTTDLIADIVQDPRFDLKVLRPAVGFNKIAEVALREIVLPVLVDRHAIGDLQELQRTKVLTLEKLARIFGVSSRQEMMEEINAVLKEFLLFGAEESNGYSPGGHTLEKDGAVAAVTFHEIAAFVKSINRNKEESGRDDAFLKSYFDTFAGRDLTVDELLNRVYLQYGYYATENIPLTFDGLTGKAQKDQVLKDLADLAARANEGGAVTLGDQRVQKAFSGKEQASTRNVEFKEVGYKFMLGEKDYIVTRPSGTEPYIRFYGQKYVPAVELSWDNIEAQKKTADDEIKEIVVAARGEFDTGSSPAAAFKIRDNDEEGFTQDAGENKVSSHGSSPIDGKLTMRDLNALAGKKVFIRTDFNVPLDGSGNIADDTRIRASLKTIRYAIDRGAKVIIGSHLGDPQKEDIEKLARAYQEREENPLAPQEALAQATREVESRFSLAPVAARLSQLLSDTSVNFSPNLRTMKDGREFIADSMRPGDILLLENVRFHRGEKKADAAFAADLFDGADVFILDAFGSAHRAHASIIGAPQGIPRVAGFLLAEETAILQRIQSGLRLAVMGGSKVSDKIRLMGTLLVSEELDYILIGGAMMNAFWKAKGRYVGASVGTEPIEVDFARAFMNHHKVKLPPDGIAVDDFKNPTQFKVINFDRDEDVPFNWVVVDIGPRARKAYGSYILESGVTFWNGPMGAFDVASVSQFAQDGTKDIASMLANAPGFTVVGGGDSLTAVNVFGFSEDDYDHLSTGGGASLKFLEEGMLPGIAALSDKIILPMDKQGLLPADDEADVVPEDLGLTAFLTPTQKVLRVLENRWQRGQMAVSLVEIMRLTGLEKEFVLAALETINSDPNISSFSVSPTGHNKKLNKETGWIELVLRPQMGGHRPPQQILRPGASPMVVQGQEEVGGINLDPALLDLQIKRDANFVPLPLPQQPIHSMNIEGFIPVIIHITPVTNLPMLLGLADAPEGEDETVPLMKGREPEEISALN